MSGLQIWRDTKTEFLSGEGALAFSKNFSILSLLQVVFKISEKSVQISTKAPLPLPGVLRVMVGMDS
jgi:hypothetical protein